MDDKEEVVKRERLAGIYRLSAYFLAIITTEIPVFIITSTGFIIIAYWMANLMRTALNFFLVWLTVLTFAYACQVINDNCMCE